MYVTHKETYWSGHNELDLKCDGLKAVLSAANSRNTRVFSEFEKWIFRCSFRQFFPKCFLFVKCAIKVAIWKNFADKHRWRCIEEVITRTTRNRLAGVEPTRGFESHALRHRSYQPRLVASFLYPEMEIAFHCACRCELWWVIKVRVDICCGWKIAMS